MNWSESAVGKVWRSVSKYGVRVGTQDAIARWGQSHLKVPLDVLGEYSWVLNPDVPPSLPAPRPGPLTINWLVPDLIEASGGTLNVIRAIHQMERWGHRHRIYIVGSTKDTVKAIRLVRESYFPIEAEIEVFNGQVADSDALVSTLWKTAYVARSIGNTARKFYFVQDLEYLFYPAGSLGEFTKQTYRWGWHGITLGPWIAQVLKEQFGMPCTSFGFSYDREIYSPTGDRYFSDSKQRVLFYARPRTERRAFELGILALSKVAEKNPNIQFVLVGFPPKSIKLPFPAILPGVVPPAVLASLYRSCNLALVLSYTNLSLLPLELMACDCAVVSNSGANVEWLLTDQTAQLADSNPEALAEAILSLLRDEQMRTRKIVAGRGLAEQTDWVTEIKRIESALYCGLGIPERSEASQATQL